VIVKEFAGSSRAEVIDEEVAVVETDTLEKCGGIPMIVPCPVYSLSVQNTSHILGNL
jgi:hypothetical protein